MPNDALWEWSEELYLPGRRLLAQPLVLLEESRNPPLVALHVRGARRELPLQRRLLLAQVLYLDT